MCCASLLETLIEKSDLKFATKFIYRVKNMKMLFTLCRKSHLLFFLSASFVLLWLAANPRSTYACSPAYPYRPSTLGERTQDAELVLEVTLLEKVPSVHPFSDTATFIVNSWLKGNGPSIVTVKGFGPSAQCLAEVPEMRAILFVNGDPFVSPLTLNYVGVHDAVVYSSPEVISEIADAIHLQNLIRRSTIVSLSVIFVIVVIIVWRKLRSLFTIE